MPLFLAIQNTYTHLQMALFKESRLLYMVEIDKTEASKKCISELQILLQNQQITLNDLSFITANQGPGPFTTLRVVISTVNGLSFARKIPLIGINALEALLNEYENHPCSNKIALLNAFGSDLYFGLQTGKSVIYGCLSIPSLLNEVSQKIPLNPILFLGNGINQCKDTISATFGNRAHFLEPNPQTTSLHQIGKMGLEYWQKQTNIRYQIQPLYIKPAFIQ